MSVLDRIGRKLLDVCQDAGEMVLLGLRASLASRDVVWSRGRIIGQMSRAGADTVGIASLSGFFIGMALALQTGYQLAKFGMEEKLGAIVSLSMCRELGPVLTAVLVSGKIGSGIAAEIATMSVGEEIDALRTLRIDPVRYLVMPRLIACVTMLPMLVIYVDVVGILGGGVMCSAYFGVPLSQYADLVSAALSFGEILRGLAKAAVFGGIIAVVGCHRGLKCTGGPEGVGRVTTQAVVVAIVSIFISNFFITRLWL